MKIHSICLMALTMTCALALHAQDRVVPHSKRLSLLNSAEDLVDVTNPELFEKLEEARYPFEFEPEKVVVVDNKPVVVKDNTPPPQPKVVTPEEVLNEFASRLRPTGMLLKGDKGILILSAGSQLVEGNTYRVNYQDKPFDIVVTKVTSDSYTLTIGDVSITQRFGDAVGTGITPDRN